MHDFDRFRSDMANRSEPQPTELTNIYQFNSSHSIPNCTVITFDGIDGFMCIGPDGVRHNEGVRWPAMRIEQNCTVQELVDEYGRKSMGWYKPDGTERTD